MVLRIAVPGKPVKFVDLGPCPEVRLKFYPRRADIDTALIGTAAARRREHSPLRLWGQP